MEQRELWQVVNRALCLIPEHRAAVKWEKWRKDLGRKEKVVLAVASHSTFPCLIVSTPSSPRTFRRAGEGAIHYAATHFPACLHSCELQRSKLFRLAAVDATDNRPITNQCIYIQNVSPPPPNVTVLYSSKTPLSFLLFMCLNPQKLY